MRALYQQPHGLLCPSSHRKEDTAWQIVGPPSDDTTKYGKKAQSSKLENTENLLVPLLREIERRRNPVRTAGRVQCENVGGIFLKSQGWHWHHVGTALVSVGGRGR